MKTISEEPVRYCACGCGDQMVRPAHVKPSVFKLRRFIKGHEQRDPERRRRNSERMLAAYQAGARESAVKKSREKRSVPRSLCLCGCGRPVRKTCHIYAPGCFQKFNVDRLSKTKGSPLHAAAKVWIIRDPYGNIHKFSNLNEWARKNQHRFKDEHPDAVCPLDVRIASGISGLLKASGNACSYKGWTAVSNMELDAGGADLLGRDYFAQNEQP